VSNVDKEPGVLYCKQDTAGQYREPELEDPEQELPEGFVEGKSNPFLLTMFIPVFKHNP
jgi:hypothetical protein